MTRSKVKRCATSAAAPGEGLLGPALQRFFCEYLINQRQLSPQTIAAYRDTFKLLLGFFEQTRGHLPDDLRIRDLDADATLGFLDYLEQGRGNCARSRNVRLAAIRSFVRHATAFDPVLLSVAQRVLAIPTKRFERRLIGHLTRGQIQAILDAPDLATVSGRRDRVLLTLMYNTGARVSELAALNVGDVNLDTTSSVHIRGKGRKQRTIPLWRQSTTLLRTWLRSRPPSAVTPLLPNARGNRMTRSGIAHRLRVLVSRAAENEPSLAAVRISPHTMRHTTAMHLLQSGVDLSVIAMWLGHESIQTTHQYLDADLETKRRALDRLKPPPAPRSNAPDQQALPTFLTGL